MASSGSSTGWIEMRCIGATSTLRSSEMYSRMHCRLAAYHGLAWPTRVSCSSSSFATVTSLYSERKMRSCCSYRSE
eukprot:scaffold96868_cov79-Phaeocystis_antarctica.AAC.2